LTKHTEKQNKIKKKKEAIMIRWQYSLIHYEKFYNVKVI